MGHGEVARPVYRILIKSGEPLTSALKRSLVQASVLARGERRASADQARTRDTWFGTLLTVCLLVSSLKNFYCTVTLYLPCRVGYCVRLIHTRDSTYRSL